MLKITALLILSSAFAAASRRDSDDPEAPPSKPKLVVLNDKDPEPDTPNASLVQDSSEVFQSVDLADQDETTEAAAVVDDLDMEIQELQDLVADFVQMMPATPKDINFVNLGYFLIQDTVAYGKPMYCVGAQENSEHYGMVVTYPFTPGAGKEFCKSEDLWFQYRDPADKTRASFLHASSQMWLKCVIPGKGKLTPGSFVGNCVVTNTIVVDAVDGYQFRAPVVRTETDLRHYKPFTLRVPKDQDEDGADTGSKFRNSILELAPNNNTLSLQVKTGKAPVYIGRVFDYFNYGCITNLNEGLLCKTIKEENKYVICPDRACNAAFCCKK